MKATMHCNGIETELNADNITDACREADELASYCQSDILVKCDKYARRRRWLGCLDGIKDNEDPIQFGEYGFYSDWEEDYE